MSDEPWTPGIPPPRPSAAVRYEVVTPRYGSPIRAALLDSAMYCRSMHYDAETRRTLPCVCRASCPYGSTGQKIKLTGWTAGQLEKTKQKVVLQFSESALRAYEGIPRDNLSVRGVCLSIGRADRRTNSQMTLEILAAPSDLILGQTFDVRPTLELLWGETGARRLRIGEPQRLARLDMQDREVEGL